MRKWFIQSPREQTNKREREERTCKKNMSPCESSPMSGRAWRVSPRPLCATLPGETSNISKRFRDTGHRVETHSPDRHGSSKRADHLRGTSLRCLACQGRRAGPLVGALRGSSQRHLRSAAIRKTLDGFGATDKMIGQRKSGYRFRSDWIGLVT